AGRQLDPTDIGPWDPEQDEYPPIVLSVWNATLGLGIEVGDLITYDVQAGGMQLGTGTSRAQQVTFHIVGLVDRTGSQVSVEFSAPNYASITAFPDSVPPTMVSAIVDIDEPQIGELRRSLSSVP